MNRFSLLLFFILGCVFHCLAVATAPKSSLPVLHSKTLSALSPTLPNASQSLYEHMQEMFNLVKNQPERQVSASAMQLISENETKHDLPIGVIQKFRGRKTYTIMDAINYDLQTNTYQCRLFTLVSVPELGKEELCFMADKVAFNNTGLVSSESITLTLLSPPNRSATINTEMGLLQLNSSQCVLLLGCAGITKITLSGNLLLKTEQFVSALDDKSPVTAHIEAFDITDSQIVNLRSNVRVDAFKIKSKGVVLQEFEFAFGEANKAVFCLNSPIYDTNTGKTLVFPTNYLGRIYGADGNYNVAEALGFGVAQLFDPNAGVGKYEHSSTDYQGLGNWTGIVAENVNIKWNCKYEGKFQKEIPLTSLAIDEFGLTTQIDLDAEKGQYTHNGQGASSNQGNSLGTDINGNSPMSANMDGREGMDKLWAVSMVALKMDINSNVIDNATCKGKVYVPFFMSNFEFKGKITLVTQKASITGKATELSDLILQQSDSEKRKILQKQLDYQLDPRKPALTQLEADKIKDMSVTKSGESRAQVGYFQYELIPAQNLTQSFRTRIGWQYEVGKGTKVMLYTNESDDFVFAFYSSGIFNAFSSSSGITFKKLTVENMRLSNRSPYFEVDKIGFQNREAGEPGHVMAGQKGGETTFYEGKNPGAYQGKGALAPGQEGPQTKDQYLAEHTPSGWGLDVGEVYFAKRKDVAGNIVASNADGTMDYVLHIDLGFSLIKETNSADNKRPDGRKDMKTSNNLDGSPNELGTGAGPGWDARFGLDFVMQTHKDSTLKLIGVDISRIRIYAKIAVTPAEMRLRIDIKLEGGMVLGSDTGKNFDQSSGITIDGEFDWENVCSFSVVGKAGKYKGQEYFFIDISYAQTGLTSIIGIPIGPIKLMPYRIGFSWHMSYGKSTNDKGEWLPKWRGNDVLIEKADGQSDNPYRQGNESNVIPQYVPDLTAGLGFKIGVQISLADPHLMTAFPTLEIIFTESWGIKTMRLFGAGSMLGKGTKSEIGKDLLGASSERSDAPVQFYLDALLDFDAGVLDMYLDAYMDFELPGYGQLMFGSGRNNYLCSVGLYVNWGRKDKPGAPVDWYFFMGRPETPSEPCLGLNLGFMRQVIYFQAYFMCGTRAPNPKLNPRLNALSKLVKMDNTEINPIALGNGLRFLVGASIEFDFGFDFFVYAYLRAGIGFNLMIADYGSAACKGGDGTPIGWLAQGSIYAYLEGGLGINFGGWKFEILELGLGATLNGQFIGNAWFHGDFSVHYCVLGGLVEGNADWSFDVGNRCVPVGKNGKIVIPKLQLISEYRPKGDQEASIFSVPAVAFNAKMTDQIHPDATKRFTEDLTAEGSEIVRRVVLEKIEFKARRNGQEVPMNVNYTWNDEHTILQISNGKEAFPGSAEYTCYVKVHVEEKKKGASNFSISRYEDADPARHYLGTVVGQDSTFRHKTAESPSRIDDENIQYTYPVRDQLNVYRKESNRGYVQLKMGQKYLLNNNNLTYVYRFTNLSKQVANIESTFTYDEGLVRVDYNSVNQLEKEQLYRLELIAKPANSRAITAGNNTIDLGDCKMKFTTINGDASIGEANLYTAYFRTSKYDKLSDKLADANRKNHRKVIDIATGYVYVFGERFQLDEPFDQYELYGDKTNTPLLELLAETDSQSWFTNYLNNFYNLCPVPYEKGNLNKKISYTHRSLTKDPGGLFRPLWDVDLYDCQGGKLALTQQAVDNRYVEMPQREFILRYLLPITAWSDYDNIREQLVDKALNGSELSKDAVYLLYTYKHRDVLPNNTYPVKIYYRLPGQSKTYLPTDISTIHNLDF